MVAKQNAAEAALVPGVRVIAASSLAAAADWLRGTPGLRRGARRRLSSSPVPLSRSRAVVPGARLPAGRLPGRRPGQLRPPRPRPGAGARPRAPRDTRPRRDARPVDGAPGRRGMRGGRPSPVPARAAGAGKTMLAERIPTILPRLDRAAALDVTSIHSVAGTLPPQVPLLTEPPFLAPHHTATKAAIVGGGSGIIRPGSASLAHRGVLFLDEAPEFDRDVLDALRQPLEAGEVVVARSGVTASFPARFTLVWPRTRARAPRRPAGRGLQLQPRHAPPVPRPAVGSAAGPGRRQDRARAGQPQGTAERPELRRVEPDRGAARDPGPGTGRPPAARDSVAAERRESPARSCAGPGRPRPARSPCSSARWSAA